MTDYFLYRNRNILSKTDWSTSKLLVDGVLDDHLLKEKVYRDNWRTLSVCIRYSGDLVMLKIPRARNLRRWERCLSVFRGSDAFRSYRHLQQMKEMGVAVPDPLLACEKRSVGFVTDSFLCYRYVEGRPAGPGDAPEVLDALRALHRRGYLRTDAQIANFLISGDSVVFIDFRLKKPWFLPALQKARELDRFLRSCPAARAALTEHESASGWLRFARWIEDLSFGIRRLKRRFRDKRKGRNSC